MRVAADYRDVYQPMFADAQAQFIAEQQQQQQQQQQQHAAGADDTGAACGSENGVVDEDEEHVEYEVYEVDEDEDEGEGRTDESTVSYMGSNLAESFTRNPAYVEVAWRTPVKGQTFISAHSGEIISVVETEDAAMGGSPPGHDRTNSSHSTLTEEVAANEMIDTADATDATDATNATNATDESDAMASPDSHTHGQDVDSGDAVRDDAPTRGGLTTHAALGDDADVADASDATDATDESAASLVVENGGRGAVGDASMGGLTRAALGDDDSSTHSSGDNEIYINGNNGGEAGGDFGGGGGSSCSSNVENAGGGDMLRGPRAAESDAMFKKAADMRSMMDTPPSALLQGASPGAGGTGGEGGDLSRGGRLSSSPLLQAPRVTSAEHWLDVEGMNRGEHVTALRHEETPLAGASSAAARRVDRRRQFDGGEVEEVVDSRAASGVPRQRRHSAFLARRAVMSGQTVMFSRIPSPKALSPHHFPRQHYDSVRQDPQRRRTPSRKEAVTLSELNVGVANVGDRVLLRMRDGSVCGGKVMFMGETSFAPQVWLGVALDNSFGKHNGAVAGVRYFTCNWGCGMFVRPSAVWAEGTPMPPTILSPSAASTESRSALSPVLDFEFLGSSGGRRRRRRPSSSNSNSSSNLGGRSSGIARPAWKGSTARHKDELPVIGTEAHEDDGDSGTTLSPSSSSPIPRAHGDGGDVADGSGDNDGTENAAEDAGNSGEGEFDHTDDADGDDIAPHRYHRTDSGVIVDLDGNSDGGDGGDGGEGGIIGNGGIGGSGDDSSSICSDEGDDNYSVRGRCYSSSYSEDEFASSVGILRAFASSVKDAGILPPSMYTADGLPATAVHANNNWRTSLRPGMLLHISVYIQSIFSVKVSLTDFLPMVPSDQRRLPRTPGWALRRGPRRVSRVAGGKYGRIRG
jgi:hypothetical protein